MRSLTAILLSLLVIAGMTAPAEAGEKNITVGTAGELGVYYPAGGAICRLVGRGVKDHGIRCTAVATSGSVYNLKALEDGKLDIGIAQTDWIYHAYKGTSDFAADGPDNKLRALFSLHPEAFTVLARADSGIVTIEDLKHKRVGIGSDGSGMLATAQEFIKAEGWSRETFAAMPEFKPLELGKALCNNTVDAILVTTGHPNGSTQETTSHCATHLIPVVGEPIDRLIEKNPYYTRVTLPANMYRGSPKPVMTFGVRATLVTTSKLSDETAYQVVKAVFDNLEGFRDLHPVFASLDKTKMVTEGLIVPLHPGALRYYKEAGLIK